MSINNVSNFRAIHIAEDYKEKWDKEAKETQNKLANITIPIGQPTAKKSETLTGLEVEKSDVTADHVERKLTSDEEIGKAEAQARKEFYQYGTENGKEVNDYKEVHKLAENYVENEKHKENVQGTQVFMDKKAYKAAEKQRKADYKEMYNQYREDGYSRKEAKQMAKARLVENEYISGRKTRKFIEDNKDYFYDENGNFSSDKFKQKAVEYANINTKGDETLNYHLSLRERRAAAQQERVSANVIKNIAKKSNLDYEKDNTNLYRGLAIGGATAVGAGIGSLFSVTSSAAAAAGSSSAADAVIGGSAAANSSSAAAAAAAASASVNGTIVGTGSGLAVGVGGSTFLRDNGKTEDRVYAPGKPQQPQTKKTPSEPDVPPTTPRQETPATETPVVEVPKKDCPVRKWAAPDCNYKVEKGDCWAGVIAGTMTVKGKVPQGKLLRALVHAEKIKHGITNFKLNTMPEVYDEDEYKKLRAKNPEAARKYKDTHTMKMYTDFTDLLENEEIMKKHPELKYLQGLKEGDIIVDCDAHGLKFSSVKPRVNPRVRYTRYTGSPMETNKYKQDCNDPVPVRINNK